MKEKLGNLRYQVVGLVTGAVAGVLVGLIVSDRADQYEVIIEEVVDGEEKA